MKFNYSFLRTLLVLGIAPLAQAENDTHTFHSVTTDAASARENPNSSIPYESGRPITKHEPRWSDLLPILGKEARDAGYVLPRPFGVSIGVMHQEQPFDVNSISLNDIDFSGLGVIKLNEVDNTETTRIARFDVWLLPFFNVYGILGKTDGRAEGPLTLDLNPLVANSHFGQFLCDRSPNQCRINRDIQLDYTGDVVGGGATVAGGYKDFFGMVDYNVTQTDLNISSTDAEAKVTSARIGWNGSAGIFNGSVWVGAMHQEVAQILDLSIPINGETLKISIDQSTQAATNTLIGARWEFTPAFEAQLEFGLGERQSQMLNISYRM